jgi:hypothetical protein
MIHRERVINLLVDRGFRLQASGQRGDFFTLHDRGKILPANVPRRDLLEEDTVRHILRFAGLSIDEMERLIGQWH